MQDQDLTILQTTNDLIEPEKLEISTHININLLELGLRENEFRRPEIYGGCQLIQTFLSENQCEQQLQFGQLGHHQQILNEIEYNSLDLALHAQQRNQQVEQNIFKIEISHQSKSKQDLSYAQIQIKAAQQNFTNDFDTLQDQIKNEDQIDTSQSNELDENNILSNSDGGEQCNSDPLNAGRWTDEEHDKFLEALRIYGKNWNKVHKHVGTRSSAQTRSHAQKYFNKLTRRGTQEAQQELMILSRKNQSNSKKESIQEESTLDNSSSANINSNQTKPKLHFTENQLVELSKTQSFEKQVYEGPYILPTSPLMTSEYQSLNQEGPINNQIESEFQLIEKDLIMESPTFKHKVSTCSISSKSKDIIKRQTSSLSVKDSINSNDKKRLKTMKKPNFRKQTTTEELPSKDQVNKQLFRIERCSKNQIAESEDYEKEDQEEQDIQIAYQPETFSLAEQLQEAFSNYQIESTHLQEDNMNNIEHYYQKNVFQEQQQYDYQTQLRLQQLQLNEYYSIVNGISSTSNSSNKEINQYSPLKDASIAGLDLPDQYRCDFDSYFQTPNQRFCQDFHFLNMDQN